MEHKNELKLISENEHGARALIWLFTPSDLNIRARSKLFKRKSFLIRGFIKAYRSFMTEKSLRMSEMFES